MEPYKPINFEILPVTEWHIVKQVSLWTKDRHGYDDLIGYVLYKRNLSDVYSMKKATDDAIGNLTTYPQQSIFPNDELDDLIFQAFRNFNAHAKVMQHLIVTSLDQDKIKILQNRQIEICSIRFTPDFSQYDFHNQPPVNLKGIQTECKFYADFKTAYTSNLAVWANVPLDRQDLLDKIQEVKFV